MPRQMSRGILFMPELEWILSMELNMKGHIKTRITFTHYLYNYNNFIIFFVLC